MRLSLIFLLVGCLLLQAECADAREALYDARPFDTLIVGAGDSETPLEVVPLDFPGGRRVPRPRPSGKLTFQLLDQPGQDVEAPWSTIKRIEFFEQRLLSEANRLVSAKEFDTAFDYFARLERDYPKLSGLESSLENYLKQDALDRFRQGKSEEALMLLQSLHERLPTAEGLVQAVDAVSNKTLTSQWDAQDFDGLRATLSTLRTQFPGLPLQVEQRWRGRIAEAAELLRDQARQLASAGKFREALRTVGDAEALEPDSPRSARLREQIRRDNPILWVGVFEQADPALSAGLDTPAARRIAWLNGRELVRLEGYGPTGGEYGGAYVETQVDDSRRSIRLSFPDKNPTAYQVARSLLAESENPSGPLITEYADTLAINASEELIITLQREHPKPEALLKGVAPKSLTATLPEKWSIAETASNRVRYNYTAGEKKPAFSIIEEVHYDDEADAIEDLLTGELDILAHVPPWRINQLRKARGIAIGFRRIPTLHCLLFGKESSLRDDREMRRALIYAIARETTLNELILAGESRPGFEPLTAPLPQGLTLGDPLRYAYNDALLLRPYEPRLAALLIRAALRAQALKNEQKEQPEIPSLVLALPSKPVPRLACDAIKKQLEKVGFKIELVEASEAELKSNKADYDLRYAEISMGEPMVDVWHLLGQDGIAGDATASMRLTLDKLQRSSTGQRVAAALREMHEVCHNDVPLLPLWQTVDYFAYRSDLQGMPDQPIGLYQSIKDWQLSDRGGR